MWGREGVSGRSEWRFQLGAVFRHKPQASDTSKPLIQIFLFPARSQNHAIARLRREAGQKAQHGRRRHCLPGLSGKGNQRAVIVKDQETASAAAVRVEDFAGPKPLRLGVAVTPACGYSVL